VGGAERNVEAPLHFSTCEPKDFFWPKHLASAIRVSLSIIERIAQCMGIHDARNASRRSAIARAARNLARPECDPLHAAHSWAGNAPSRVDLGHCVADTARGGGDHVELTSRVIATHW